MPALALCVASQGHSSDSGISELCFFSERRHCNADKYHHRFYYLNTA
ncbi:hypothetical protein EM595_0912 [Duffyella gerundensis]|uniref:Uncharacterized protein n=1 Tax=Duffyella gerundensis TaxID=1619313 RepID=A0A0U5LLE5_9GAMM|nr:hypothetical protein EM595_0912 [Duffyella gerundensis]